MVSAAASASPALVVVLNEARPRDAVDWYVALDRLVVQGVLRDYTVVPYLSRLAEGVSGPELLGEITDAAQLSGATLVLWAHTHGIEVDAQTVARLRAVAAGTAMGYWDGDWYHWYRQPFPRELRRLCRQSDVAFVCGDGWLVSRLHRDGCPDVRYVPLSTDFRFGRQTPRPSYDYDAVLIGNCIRSRYPFKDMPGAVFRRRLVDTFARRLGRRFAVFGFGWTGPSARGPISYEQQAEVYGLAPCALGCSNWFTRYYFSDRLPIAMSTGRAVVHYRDAGFDEVFGADAGVFWYTEIDGAWQQVRRVLDDPAAADAAAQRAHDLATARFTTYDTLAYMVEVLAAHARARERGGSVNLVRNPWIERPTL